MKTYFHISHYKSMETLSCHSDKCTWANAIKKHSFCRGTYYEHFCKVSASFPLWLLRRWFFMCPNDAGGMANSVVPDQTHPCLHYSVWKLRIITVFQSLCSFKMAYYLFFLHLTLCGFLFQLHLLLIFYRKEFHWVCGVTLSWNL